MDLTFDPRLTALVLIDLQRGIVNRQFAPHPPAAVLENSALLADALRKQEGTVVFVRILLHDVLALPVDQPSPIAPGSFPPDATELAPETRVQPSDLIIAKRQWGAFYGTDLEQQLRRRRIQTIIMGGIATNIGVESTARAAFDRGYELIFAEDAMSSVSTEAHNFATTNIFPRMGRVRSTQQILAALR
jgi:nicotinamidase-related amidase